MRRFLSLPMLCGVVLLTSCDSGGAVGDVEQDASSSTACECELNWQVDSVVPCIAPPAVFPSIIFSSHADERRGDEVGAEAPLDTVPDCNAAVGFPQPVPPEPWSKQRIRAQCSGDATLCIALKHGRAKEPTADDCEIMKHCFDASYDTIGEVMELPELPGWAASDGECSNKFYEEGGYVEFSGTGDLGCTGTARITRVQLCPPECRTDPKASVCKDCGDAEISSSF